MNPKCRGCGKYFMKYVEGYPPLDEDGHVIENFEDFCDECNMNIMVNESG